MKSWLTLFVLIALSGCAAGGQTKRTTRVYDDEMSKQLFDKSLVELEKGEYAPAISSLIRAERLSKDENLKLEISEFQTDLLNRVKIITAIEEEKRTLKYTLLYIEEEVLYPIENMNVRFSFLEGEGILTESVSTDSNGTAQSTIAKVTSSDRTLVVEAVPVVHVDKEIVRIDALKRDFIFSRKSAVGKSRKDWILEIIKSLRGGMGMHSPGPH